MSLVWYDADTINDLIVSSRIRLARNVSLEGFIIKDLKKAKELTLNVSKILNRNNNFKLYNMRELDELSIGCLVEQHYISPKLAQNIQTGAVLISADKEISIMINEEDQIREQCIMSGFKLVECYKRLNAIDNTLSKQLDFVFDKKLGYLTACPSNVGTGMRASVMMFLPALTESGQMPAVVDKANELGLAIRGVYGEGSSADCYMYQISNEVTLGISEDEIIKGVTETVNRISDAEIKTRKTIYANNPLQVKDKCKRAYGILTNCVLLNYEEFLKLITLVKLGVTLGIFSFEDKYVIDDIILNAAPNCISKQYDALSPTEENMYRAEYVSNKLKNITLR